MKKIIVILLVLSMFTALCACGEHPAAAEQIQEKPAAEEASAPEAAPTSAPEATPKPAPTPTPAPLTLEEEDQLIDEARWTDGFGRGDKLAIYVLELDFDDNWYSFHGAWLPEELRARRPEEIGAFLNYYRNEDGFYSVGLSPAISSLPYASWLYKQALFLNSSSLEEINGSTPLAGGGTLGEFVRKELPPILKRQAELESEMNEQIGQRRTEMAAEDKLIREAMEKEGFGFGDKLAVYVDADDQYSFHGAWLPEELRAETPEEIGAFLYYELYGGQVSSVRVEGAGAEIPAYKYHLWAILDDNPPLEEVDGSTALYEAGTLEEFLAEKVPLVLEQQAEMLRDQEEREQKKLKEAQQKERLDSSRQKQLLDLLNDPSQSPEFGNGAYFVGYNEDKGVYEMGRVPIALRTSFLEEVGYILSYSSSWTTKTGKYTSGELEVELETFKGKILDADTGKVIGTFTKKATLPYVVTTRNGKADPQYIWESTILDNIRAAFKGHHLDWPYED